MSLTFNKLQDLRQELLSIHSTTRYFHRSCKEHCDKVHVFWKKEELTKATREQRGYLRGLNEALFWDIQTNLVVWRQVYTNRSGNVVRAKSWIDLPEYEKKKHRENRGYSIGQHVWKDDETKEW